MKKIGGWLLLIGGGLWAFLTFLASNSPADVQQRASGWLSLPIIRALPDKLIAFASEPAIFALTFFVFGALGGWRTTKWWNGREQLPWWDMLGVEMSLLAYQIEDFNGTPDLNRLSADIDVVSIKAAKHGLPFPKMSAGFATVQSLLPYLTRVSAHLKAGHVDHARSAAQQLSAKPIQ